MSKPSAIVIGAGIVGLAVAKALSEKGWEVTVIERHPKSIGASIRNFGMIWPVGQAQGITYKRAIRSKEIWLDMSEKAGFWMEETGALHLAYSELENQVIAEYVAAMQQVKSAVHLNPKQTQQLSHAAVIKGLKGSLWTTDEAIVDPREAIWKIAAYLESALDVTFIWNTAVHEIVNNTVKSGNKTWKSDRVFVCNGADFETLYPSIFEETPITKCKLQMMRLVKQPENWRIGPPLCAGLSFIHYKGFDVAQSLPELQAAYVAQYPDLLSMGIHVMVSQNGAGQLTIGDSHEYGKHLDPFDKQEINLKIIDFLKSFAAFKDWTLESSWHGIYPKMTDGSTEFISEISPYVTIVNGMGGAGMTLSFGLGKEVVEKI